MTLESKTFAEIVTFSRAGGATRFNAAGKLVGVDFSATSLAVGTGSKAFTLTATASNDRDWPVGSAVLATATAGATATMTGVVASYVPSTQVLTLTIASITGSGTGTAWRIGSLEKRLNFDPVTLLPKGLFVEGAATNLVIGSESGVNGIGATISQDAVIAPDGSTTGDTISVTSGGTASRGEKAVTLTSGAIHFVTVFIKAGTVSTCDVRLTRGPTSLGLLDGVSLSAGWNRVSFPSFAADGTAGTIIVYPRSRLAAQTAGDSVSVWGWQVEAGAASASSYIPTTASQVTRVADTSLIDGVRLTQLFNPTEGTLFFDGALINANNGSHGAGGSTIFSFMRDSASSLRHFAAFRFNNRLYVTIADSALGVAINNVDSGLSLPPAGVPVKLTVSYKAGVGLKFSVNGVSSAVAATSISPDVTWDRLDMVSAFDAVRTPKQIKNFRYYPRELSLADQEALTA